MRRCVLCVLFLALLYISAIGSGGNSFEHWEHLRKSGPRDSVRYFLLQQSKVVGDQLESVRHALNWVDYHRKAAQLDSALAFCKIAEKLAETDREHGLIARKKGQVWLALNRDSLAGQSYRTALLLTTDTLERAAVLHSLCKFHQRNGDLDSGYNCLVQAEALLRDTDEQKNYATVLNSMGIHFLNRSMYDSAAHFFVLSLESYKAVEDHFNTARSYDLLGSVFYGQGNLEEAQGAYQSARALFMEQGMSRTSLGTDMNLATVMSELGEKEASKAMFRKALQGARELKLQNIEGICINNLANLLEEEGKIDSAVAYMEMALAISESTNDRDGMAYAHFNLAEFQEGELQDRIYLNHLHQAASLSRKMESNALLVRILGAIGLRYENTGRLDSALHYVKAHNELKASLESSEVKENLANIRGGYEQQIATLENDRLRFELKDQELDLTIQKNRVWLISLGLALVIVTFLILAYIYYQRGQMRQRALELATQKLEKEAVEKELVATRLQRSKEMIKEKNRIILNFETYASSPEARENLIKGVARHLDWAQFMVEFEALYPGFFKKLEKLPVKLSKNDFRVAALMKLKLSNKEMAEVLHISLSGVKAAKNRFRAKFPDMNPDELIERA